MNPEQWLSLKWNGGSTMSDRWLNQSKIIQRLIISHGSKGFFLIESEQKIIDTRNPSFINESKSSDR